MKRQVFQFSISYAIVIALLISGHLALADSEKRKTINKSYQVSSSTDLTFSNSFGKMHVETWDKNEVKVNIEVVVRASSDERAQKLLDKITIDIDDNNPKSELSYRTSINNNNSGRSSSFEVNYNLSVPKTSNLTLKNSFGDTYLDDHSGETELDVQYGNLKAGKLSGECDVKLSFGSGFSEIDAMPSGNLKVSYSKLSVEEMGNVDVNSQFSTFTNESADRINLIAKYGEVEFGKLNYLDADVNFSGFELDEIHKSIVLDIDYGGSIDIGIKKTVELVDIKSSFGPVNIELDEGVNGTVEAKMSFCDLRYDEEKINFNKIIKEHTSSEYEGKIGNGNGTKFKIVSKYGNVRIR